MAWNGSNSAGDGAASMKSPCNQTIKQSNNQTVRHGIVAGLIVVALGGAAVWWFVGGGKGIDRPASNGRDRARPSRIVEATPHITTNASVKTVVAEKPREKTRAEIMMEGRDTNKWMYVKNPLTGEEYVSRIFRPTDQFKTKALYKNQALNELDGILFSDMSDELVGLTIDKRFMDSLQQAFIDGVEQNADDDEETSARKSEMKSTLDSLRESLKNGEDIQAMIKDALHEHRKVAALKDQMKEERRIMREEGATTQEIEDFEDACNKILDEKGASPMITRRAFSEKVRAKAEQNNNLTGGQE